MRLDTDMMCAQAHDPLAHRGRKLRAKGRFFVHAAHRLMETNGAGGKLVVAL
ncbi:MAG: hypothetical protein JO216_15555 [Hyphomicrobiales bacterium]|nr:hypothetical protein [Hyphomicrobiales bacterium]